MASGGWANAEGDRGGDGGWANAFEADPTPHAHLPSYGVAAEKTVVMANLNAATSPLRHTASSPTRHTRQTRPKSAATKSKTKAVKAVSRPPRPASANTTSLNLTRASYATKRLGTSSSNSFYQPRAGLSASGLRLKRKGKDKRRSKPPPRFGAMGFAESINMREIESTRSRDANDNAFLRYNTLSKSRSEPVLQRYVRQPATTKAPSTNYRHTSSSRPTAHTHKGKHKKKGAKKNSSLASKARPPRAATAARMRTTALGPSSLASGSTGGGETFAYGPYYPSTADLGKGHSYHRGGEGENTVLGGSKCRAMPDRIANMANKMGQLGTLVTRCEGTPEVWRERGRAVPL